MKKIFFALLLWASFSCSLFAQSTSSSSIGWFITPEVGAIFHEDHLGRTVGASMGLKLWKDRLKVGLQVYGRPGPINPTIFMVPTSDGQVYRGSTTLRLRADHGAFGLLVAPSFDLGKWKLDIPLNFGSVGGGFYLFGEDRETPDGRRVSEWENELMDGRDAGFGTWLEFGVRAFVPLKTPGISIGAGLHYTMTPGWETYLDPNGDLYNNRLRLSILIHFESN